MQICVSKKRLYVFFIMFFLVLSAVILNILLNRPRTTSTRASEEQDFNYIIGGTPTTVEKWPFIVAIIKKGTMYSEGEYQNDDHLFASDLQFCGGSVIGTRLASRAK